MMRLSSPSLSSVPPNTLQSQRSGGFGVKKVLLPAVTGLAMTLGGCELANVPNGIAKDALHSIGYKEGTIGNMLKNVKAGFTANGTPHKVEDSLNKDGWKNWLWNRAEENNCDFTKAVLGTSMPLKKVIGDASETKQGKPLGLSVLPPGAFQTEASKEEKKLKLLEVALTHNPLPQQNPKPKQTLTDLKKKYSVFDLASAKLGLLGARERIARDILENDLGQEAKRELTKLSETDPKLAQELSEVLDTAQKKSTSTQSPTTFVSESGVSTGDPELDALCNQASRFNGTDPTKVRLSLYGKGACETVVRINDEAKVSGFGSNYITPEVKNILNSFSGGTPIPQLTVQNRIDLGSFYADQLNGALNIPDPRSLTNEEVVNLAASFGQTDLFTKINLINQVNEQTRFLADGFLGTGN